MDQLKKQTILIGSPVFQKSKILRAFLDFLKQLKRERITFDDLFLVDSELILLPEPAEWVYDEKK